MTKRKKLKPTSLIVPLIKCVEPEKRMVGGRYGWAVHRFPIKGGVTLSVIWAEEIFNQAARPSFFSKMNLEKP